MQLGLMPQCGQNISLDVEAVKQRWHSNKPAPVRKWIQWVRYFFNLFVRDFSCRTASNKKQLEQNYVLIIFNRCMNPDNYRCCQFLQCGEIEMCWPYPVFLCQVCISHMDLLPVSVTGALQYCCSTSQILFSFTPAIIEARITTTTSVKLCWPQTNANDNTIRSV